MIKFNKMQSNNHKSKVWEVTYNNNQNMTMYKISKTITHKSSSVGNN